MNLQEAIKFRDEKLAEGYKFDGCSFAPELGIHDWCVMHDALKHFGVIPALQADNLFFKGIMTKGYRYLPVAIIYWTAVRLFSIVGFRLSSAK